MLKENKYIGLRYIPKVCGEWQSTEEYEHLSVVTKDGNSYTSRKAVPVGIDISDTEYWVQTANFNQQLATVQGVIDVARKEIETLKLKKGYKYYVTPEDFGAKGDGVTDDTQAMKDAITATNVLLLVSGKSYLVKETLKLKSNFILDGNGSTILFAARTTNKDIDISGLEHVTIKNLVIDNEPCGGYIIGCNDSTDIYSKHIKIDGITYVGKQSGSLNRGMFLSNVEHAVIENCYLKDETQVSSIASELESGIILHSDHTFGTNSRNVIVKNNTINGFYQGIKSYGTGSNGTGNKQVLQIKDNVIEGSKKEAIYSYHSPGSIIDGNTINGCGLGIFSDSGNDVDLSGGTNGGRELNIVTNNNINGVTVGIYTEEARNMIMSGNHVVRATEAGIIVGGGSSYGLVTHNNLTECYDGIVLDMDFNPNKYHICAINVVDNVVTSSKRHAIYSKKCLHAIIKNNFIKYWGLIGNPDVNFSSGIRIEGKTNIKVIEGNIFDNKVSYASDETAGESYACISDKLESNGYDELTISNNNMLRGTGKSVEILNKCNKRYVLYNLFVGDVSFNTGYESAYVHKGNTVLVDANN